MSPWIMCPVLLRVIRSECAASLPLGSSLEIVSRSCGMAEPNGVGSKSRLWTISKAEEYGMIHRGEHIDSLCS
jgi:hypothetical protein